MYCITSKTEYGTRLEMMVMQITKYKLIRAESAVSYMGRNTGRGWCEILYKKNTDTADMWRSLTGVHIINYSENMYYFTKIYRESRGQGQIYRDKTYLRAKRVNEDHAMIVVMVSLLWQCPWLKIYLSPEWLWWRWSGWPPHDGAMISWYPSR